MAEGMTAEPGNEPKQRPQDRRGLNRAKVNWRGRLMTPRGSFDCRVLDLSPGGALVG
jgi:hypothetical protein